MTIVHYIVYIYWGMFGRGSDRRRDVFSTLALLTVLPLSQQAAWSTLPSFFIFSFKETLIWIKPTQTCCTQFRHTKKLVETKLNRSLPKFRKVEGQEFVKFGCKVNQRYNTMLLEADFLANLSKYSFLVISLCFCPEVPYNK